MLTEIEVELQLEGLIVATAPLKVTVLVPGVSPKLLPVMVTGVAMAPLLGEMPVIKGRGAVVPVPVRVELLGLLFDVLFTVTVPGRGPACEGINIILKVQVPPAGTLAWHTVALPSGEL